MKPYLRDALWERCRAALPPRPEKPHPWGCHRKRVPDEVVFDHLLRVLVLGATYEQAASEACSATTMRRWRDWLIKVGAAEALEADALAHYDELVGLELNRVAIDGCIVKSPRGGEIAGPSPVDRRKLGTKRSLAVDANGVPLATVLAAANRNDCVLLEPTLEKLAAAGMLREGATVHVDKGYVGRPVADALERRGLRGEVGAPRGAANPRWVVERTNAWHNAFGKLRRSTERRHSVMAFFVSLANAAITLRLALRARLRGAVTTGGDSRP